MRAGEEVGRANVAVAWWMIGLSMLAGAVLGAWSFGGPAAPPPGFETYDALPRRLVRLAHIAAIMLPVLNLLYVPAAARFAMRRSCALLLFGTVALPALLALAAFWPHGLHLLPLAVLPIVAAVFALAFRLSRREPS
jgi:hypothetical protein